MPTYGERSLRVRSEIDQRLVRVFDLVLARGIDHALIEGERSEADQNRHFAAGRSQKQFPDSKHNVTEEQRVAGWKSRAVHALPYPVQWTGPDARERFHFFAGLVIATGLEVGVRVRWGGDWNENFDIRDNGFDDLAHYEVENPRTRR